MSEQKRRKPPMKPDTEAEGRVELARRKNREQDERLGAAEQRLMLVAAWDAARVAAWDAARALLVRDLTSPPSSSMCSMDRGRK